MLERARLGMAMFLLSQAVFFLFLIIGSIYFNQAAIDASDLYTVSLAASSVTMWRAAASAERNNVSSVGRWLGATILLGGAFVGGRGRIYLHAFPYRNAVSALFTLVSCHELYAAAGILLVGIALWNRGRSVIVQTVAMYWYFVTAVWIAIVAVGFIV